MKTTPREEYLVQLAALRAWMPHMEYSVLRKSREHTDIINELHERIASMPKSYATDGQGLDALVQLHYFIGGSDWYLTERDMQGEGIDQCFGWVVLNGQLDCAELGYVSVRELVAHGVELDLHWTPKTLRAVQQERNA